MANTQWTTTLKVRLILYHKGEILLLRQTRANGGNHTRNEVVWEKPLVQVEG